MNKYIIPILFILLVYGGSSYAEPFKVPPISPGEKGTIVTEYKDGGIRWKADWTTNIYTENGVTKFKLVFNAEGATTPFSRNQKLTWQSIAIWKAEDKFLPLSSETKIKDLAGNVIMIDEKTFNYKRDTAVFAREDLRLGTYDRKLYDITPDTLILEGITYALRDLPFGTEKTVNSKLLSNEPELYNVEYKERGIEKIQTANGEVECYKVEIVPKLGMRNLFKVFFPKTYFWFSVEPPHKWVRYEGYENGIDSPEVIMTVTNN